MIENLRPEVDRLKAQYAELASKYRAKYPPLLEAKAKLDAAEKRLTAEIASIARAVNEITTPPWPGKTIFSGKLPKNGSAIFGLMTYLSKTPSSYGKYKLTVNSIKMYCSEHMR